jgi:hypothetical protein
MRHVLALVALLATGCASVPLDLDNGGVALAKTGWRFSGGMDFERKAWVLTFWRPWGKQEKDAAIDAEKIVLPE